MSLKILNEKPSSFFDHKSINDVYSEIQGVYLSDNRPWIIGYSGGKDSTAALQLVWYAIKELPKEKVTKPVYVISSDTLVESPPIVKAIDDSLKNINKAAKEQGLPFQAHKVVPIASETFWANLLGKGYPAPQQTFRWCTDRMKIKPADRFILQKVDSYGEVVLVLGVRKSESMTRAQVMSLYKIKGSILSRHSKFPQTWVYTPVENFSLDDVWTYLLQTPNPWGNNNRDLAALYKNGQTGECPLVVDKSTPSCGNSRFGCWTCTVVERDKTMESMIDNGEEWMQPLLEIRDLLSSTQDPEKKHQYRELKRRQGFVSFKSDGSGKITPGPYKLEFCKEVLKKILEAEVKIKKTESGKNVNLILPEELHEIRRIWLLERGDWEDSVPKIYKEVTGRDLNWTKEDLGYFTGKELELLNKICLKNKIPLRLVSKLLDVEYQTQGMKRRASVYSKIDGVLKEEWRSKEEILNDHNGNCEKKVAL